MRCINLDWLEVHAHENTSCARNALYFESKGYFVKRRDYGTRVYREMFIIVDAHDEPLIEVRRNPASSGLKGIHDYNECHLRFSNRTCYFDNAALFMISFLEKHSYYDIRISRVDLCLDFVKFDSGDNPEDFVRRYFRHRYAKVNQGRITGHGEDTWTGQEWNSLSWGSKTSCVTTKLYNKTMELYDQKLDRYRKPYIREAWFRCGFIDDIQHVTKDGNKIDVWRLEFSLTSAVKNWVAIEIDGKAKNYQSLRNSLEVYDSREKILVMFISLCNHYFRFKKYVEGVRKDRCEDKVLFSWGSVEQVYKIGRNNTALGSGKTYICMYNRLLEKIKAYQQSHYGAELHKACDVIIASITEEKMRSELANPWSREELQFLRELIHVRTENKDWSYDAALSEVKKLLSITNRTISQF